MFEANTTLNENSSDVPLSGGATFTGIWTDVENYDSVMVAVKSDQAGTLYADFSPDGVNVDSTLTYDVAANIPDIHRLAVGRKYFRARYTNGSVAQTFMRLQSMAGRQGILTSPLNLAIQRDADALVTRSYPEFLEIATNKFSDVTKVNQTGYNPSISSATVPEWLWTLGGVYTGFPTGSAETITVTSTSANDTNGGSGAQVVRIQGLDANYLVQSEDLTLNGTGGATTTASFMRVHNAFVIQSGSSNQAFNEGTLTFNHSTTTANVFLSMEPGRNQTYAAIYTVPDNKQGVLIDISVELEKGNAGAVGGALWIREFGKPPRYDRQFTVSNATTYTEAPYGGITLPPKTDIGLVALTSSANALIVYGTYNLVIIPND